MLPAPLTYRCLHADRIPVWALIALRWTTVVAVGVGFLHVGAASPAVHLFNFEQGARTMFWRLRFGLASCPYNWRLRECATLEQHLLSFGWLPRPAASGWVVRQLRLSMAVVVVVVVVVVGARCCACQRTRVHQRTRTCQLCACLCVSVHAWLCCVALLSHRRTPSGARVDPTPRRVGFLRVPLHHCEYNDGHPGGSPLPAAIVNVSRVSIGVCVCMWQTRMLFLLVTRPPSTRRTSRRLPC